MSRVLAALLLSLACGVSAAGPVVPSLPCDRPVLVFAGRGALAEGVREPGRNDFATRLRTFFERVCRRAVDFEAVATETERLLGHSDAIAGRIAKATGGIAIVHFPFGDVEASASAVEILGAYRRILRACESGGSLCVVGGQQPVNAFDRRANDLQLELERRAATEFGAAYLAMHRYFASEREDRRLMLPLDSGDGRHVDDFGHELLFSLYRRRLMELTAPGQSRRAAAAAASR